MSKHRKETKRERERGRDTQSNKQIDVEKINEGRMYKVDVHRNGGWRKWNNCKNTRSVVFVEYYLKNCIRKGG